jgi:hypothetical protein
MGSEELGLQVCFMVVDLGSGRKIWNSFEDTCSAISGRRPCLQTNTNPNSRTNQNNAQWFIYMDIFQLLGDIKAGLLSLTVDQVGTYIHQFDLQRIRQVAAS